MAKENIALKAKKETMKFLEGLTYAQLEYVKTITKYNKCSCKNAWDEFFEY